MIREVTHSDAQVIAEIYNHYVRNTVITFEEEEVTASEMIARIEKILSSGFSWLVAVVDGQVIGYAYSSKWHARSAYRHTAEVSVYLSPNQQTKGWGSKLYKHLFNTLQEKSIRIAIGCIALPNRESVALHEKFGMQKVGHFREVGLKFGEWIDVGYWQVQLSG